MDLKFSKKISAEKLATKSKKKLWEGFSLKNSTKKLWNSAPGDTKGSPWNYLIVFVMFFGLFSVLLWQLSTLQIINGDEMLAKSESNQLRKESIAAYRGVVFDRNGTKLVENIASSSLYIMIDKYLVENEVNEAQLQSTCDTIGGILNTHWKKTSDDQAIEYSSIYDRVLKIHSASPYFTDILVASDLSNEEVIQIKAASDTLQGIYIDDGSKRSYPYKELLSSILGYTGNVTAEDLESIDYLNSTDIVGRTGLERKYDKQLAGEDGQMVWEVDALGKKISEQGLTLRKPVSGENLYLTLDMSIQSKLYDVLKAGTSSAKATGAAGIIEDVNTGEILGMVTYPSYDNNLFIGGISVSDYSKLLNDKANPLMNRAIAAQVPAGSTFKTMVAVAAFDAGAITKYTQYTSTSNYTFSNGASFQEYHNHAYGTLNVVGALTVSSNIYFCELIRHWDMNALVPYLDKFGIGKLTGIDIPGEMAGRMPSPSNKLLLANSTSPWLDPVWYPEGDSCNSVIGQGITLVTPLQMSNWVAAIANKGTLYKPHIAKYFVDEAGNKSEIPVEILQSNIAKTEAFNISQEGMWSAVNGHGASISSLANLGVTVAAKTGTAEFGALDKKGNYEHTHAWVTGFFPYENPKYSFSIFLEDGGESINAVKIMKEMIAWMVAEGKI
jgi:penicillin-binding protein 2